MEAVGLPQLQQSFINDTGIQMSWIIALFENSWGAAPTAADALEFAQSADDPPMPVLADFTERIVPSTPWNAEALPGKCVLSPQMEILGCFIGMDNTPIFDTIRAHAESAR